MAESINVPLVVSLLGAPGDSTSTQLETSVAALFAKGAESLLGALGALEDEKKRGSESARFPILLLTLEDEALLSLARAAAASAARGGHEVRIFAMRVGNGNGPVPDGVERLWKFPSAKKDPHKTFDMLAAGAWLALRAQVRLFAHEPAFTPDRVRTMDELADVSLPQFWWATARSGRLRGEELALGPFYDKGHRPFQPPVRRMDDPERGLVGCLTLDPARPLLRASQLDLPPAKKHDHHHLTWEQLWAAENLGPIVRWNTLPPEEDMPVEQTDGWRNLWSADGAEQTVAPPQRESVRELAVAYCRTHVARKPVEEASSFVRGCLLGWDLAKKSQSVFRRSIGLLIGSLLNLSFGACVAFAIYAKLSDSEGAKLFWAGVFTVLALAGVVIASSRHNQETKRFDEDLRGLREALRVQIFFWLGRDAEFAADQFPRGHRGRLGAVRMAAANLALAALRSEDWPPDPVPTHDEAMDVRRLWVEQQSVRLLGRPEGAPALQKDERKQAKVAQHETLEAASHGLAQGLTAVAIAGAAIHALALLGSHLPKSVLDGAPALALAAAGTIAALVVAFRGRLLTWLKHDEGLHTVPPLVGFFGGLLLVGAWAFGARLAADWLLNCLGLEGALYVKAKSLPYWWVSGCVLAGLLAGILHTRHHLLNLGGNLANARAAGILHFATSRAMAEILRMPPSTPGGPLDSPAAEEFRAYTRELGRTALAENSRWLLEQRARPLTLPHLT